MTNDTIAHMKVFLGIMAVLILLGSAGTAYYFYDKYQDAQYALDNPETIAQNEVKMLTDQLGKLIELPTDEEPSVATVLEKEKLQDQPFFKAAENGDKVIIYTKAMKAILFRSSINKIIEVAPIQISQPEGTDASDTETKTPQPVAQDEVEANQ